MESYHVNENHIGSAVSESLRLILSFPENQRQFYRGFTLQIKTKTRILKTHLTIFLTTNEKTRKQKIEMGILNTLTKKQ